ncbi:MAG: sugar ABC transporter permease [Armatimonadetes bacterium]|nr:sugar ABC transporter permease [Armatimonadota bacterium]
MDVTALRTSTAPRSRARRWLAEWPVLALNLPSALVLAVLVLLPAAAAVVFSLHTIRIGEGIILRFVGLQQFLAMPAIPEVWIALKNTAYFGLLSVALTVLIGTAIALIIDSDFPGHKVLLALVIVPWATPNIINALMWSWIYDAAYGSLNGVLYSLGLISEYQAWLSTPASAMHAVVFAYVWKLVPFVVITIYAALQAVPTEIYEAAATDGATGRHVLRSITLPLISPAVMVSVVFCTIWSLRVFDLIYVLTRGGPGRATFILNWYAFAQAFEFGTMGRASALGTLLGVITFILTYAYVRVLRVDRGLA